VAIIKLPFFEDSIFNPIGYSSFVISLKLKTPISVLNDFDLFVVADVTSNTLSGIKP
jgi:hypothetical protein